MEACYHFFTPQGNEFEKVVFHKFWLKKSIHSVQEIYNGTA